MIGIDEIRTVAPDSETLKRMKSDRKFTFDVLDWWTWQVRIRSTGMILPHDPDLRRVSAAIYRLADSLGMAPSRSDFFRKLPIALDKPKSASPKRLPTAEDLRLASADAWADYEEARWILEELREMLPDAGTKVVKVRNETTPAATK